MWDRPSDLSPLTRPFTHPMIQITIPASHPAARRLAATHARHAAPASAASSFPNESGTIGYPKMEPTSGLLYRRSAHATRLPRHVAAFANASSSHAAWHVAASAGPAASFSPAGALSASCPPGRPGPGIAARLAAAHSSSPASRPGPSHGTARRIAASAAPSSSSASGGNGNGSGGGTGKPGAGRGEAAAAAAPGFSRE